MNEINKFFSDAEIACQCGKCDFKQSDPVTLQMAYSARLLANIPFRITSWCRCPAHNAAVGGTPNSAHTRRKALDIGFRTSGEAHVIVKSLFTAGFLRVGINWERNFVHADTDESLPNPVLFKY